MYTVYTVGFDLFQMKGCGDVVMSQDEVMVSEARVQSGHLKYHDSLKTIPVPCYSAHVPLKD